MSTSNDAWNGFNVTMSISQSLDDEDPKKVEAQLENKIAICDLDNVGNCKKIDFSLDENFQPPLTVTFMWDGDGLYFNYFKHNSGLKTYAFNSWKRFTLGEKKCMNTSYVRVLYKLAVKGELDNDEKKLLMFSIINDIYASLYQDECYDEDNPTICNESDCDSLGTFITGILESALYNNIHDNVKTDLPCTKEKFVEEMNNFFTKNQEEENKQQNSQNLNNNSTNNLNYGYDNNEKNEINQEGENKQPNSQNLNISKSTNNFNHEYDNDEKNEINQEGENEQQNNQILNTGNSTNNFNHGYDNNKKNEINNNGYCDKCIT